MTHTTGTCYPSIGLRHTQFGHVVPRIRQGGGKGGDVYMRLVKQPSHLFRLSSTGLPKDNVPTSESGQVVDAFGGYCENLFGGENNVRSVEKQKPDRWPYKVQLQRKNPNLSWTRFRARMCIISILPGEARRGRDALQVTVAQQLSLFGGCLLWRGNAKLCLL